MARKGAHWSTPFSEFEPLLPFVKSNSSSHDDSLLMFFALHLNVSIQGRYTLNTCLDMLGSNLLELGGIFQR